MNAKQYRRHLERLGLSQNDAATLLGVSLRTSQSYALDESNIPRAVSMILQLLLNGTVTIGQLDKLRP